MCLMVVLGAALCSQAHADLEQVEYHYMFNEYDEALQLLAQLAATEPEATAASLEHQVWLARCLVQAGDSEAAREAFCRVHSLDRDWQPDPVLVPIEEQEAFERAVADCPRGPVLLSIITDPAGARAWLDGLPLDGATPLTGLQRDPGTYELSLRREGYQERTEHIEIEWPETVIERVLQPAPRMPRPDLLPEKTRSGAVTRSLVLPGYGQHYKRQPTRGKILAGAATVTAGMAIWGHLQRNSRLDAHDRALDDYLAAVTPEELARTFAIYEDQADAVQRAEDLRDIGFYAFVGVYVVNLVDAALGFPLEEQNVRVSAEAPDPGEARLTFSIMGR